MKIHYKQSIMMSLDEIANLSDHALDKIEYVELSPDEYIQFLEELGPTTQRILLNIPGQPRMYRGIILKVLMA